MCANAVRDLTRSVSNLVGGVANSFNAGLSSAGRSAEDFARSLGDSPTLRSAATLGMSDVYNVLIADPQRRMQDLADAQMREQEKLVADQKEQQRLSDLNYQRDLSRIRSRSMARSRSAGFGGSTIGVSSSPSAGRSTLIGS